VGHGFSKDQLLIYRKMANVKSQKKSHKSSPLKTSIYYNVLFGVINNIRF